MISRSATSVIVKVTVVNLDGEARTMYYGRFLPHVGSATTTFLDELLHEPSRSALCAGV